MRYHFLFVSMLLLSSGQMSAQTRSAGETAQTKQAANAQLIEPGVFLYSSSNLT